MASLNPRFYTLIYSNKHVDPNYKDYQVTYSGYVPKFGQPMALFSKLDGLPLAILELRYQDLENYAQGYDSFITELSPDVSNGKQSFQGIVTRDKQKVEFVITNLTDDYINFNLMKCNKKVDEVNPKGLNEINELRPYESYAIRSDQTLGNKVIILKAHELEEPKDNKPDNFIKLKDELKQDNSEKVGTYLYISVVPRFGNENLIDRFESTFWKPVNSFVVKSRTKKSITKKYKHLISSNDYFDDCVLESSIGTKNNSFASLEGSQYRGTTDININSSSLRIPTHGIRSDINKKCAVNNLCMTSTIEPDTSVRKSTILSKDKKADLVLSQDVMESNVGNIITGDDMVSVNSIQTDITYNFDKHSIPCVLGISVMEGFKLTRSLSNNELETEIKELITSYIDNTFHKLISQMQIYTLENCCICFEGKPNAVFYRCGHKCADYYCAIQLDKCPLCRALVAAVIDDKTTEKSTDVLNINISVENDNLD